MDDLLSKFGYRYLTRHRTQFFIAISKATIYGITHHWTYYGNPEDEL